MKSRPRLRHHLNVLRSRRLNTTAAETVPAPAWWLRRLVRQGWGWVAWLVWRKGGDR